MWMCGDMNIESKTFPQSTIENVDQDITPENTHSIVSQTKKSHRNIPIREVVNEGRGLD